MTEEMGKEAMFDFLYKLPEQFEACLQMDFSWVQRLGGEYRNILVTGLGGSAIGGDVLRSYCLTRAAIPVVVNRDYRVPAFAGPDTLVFAVSYSGNTEETLSAYGELKDKGARIIAVTTGGRLGEMARQHGYPVVEIPAGLVPRAATAYLFAPTALILKEMGLLSGVRTELEETVQVLRELRDQLKPGVAAPQNQARMIAGKLVNAIPVIWGSSCTSEIAAQRWKGQVNENAKSPAYFNQFPELNHNEIVGFEAPEELVGRLAVVILRDEADHERVQKRIEITKSIIDGRVKSVTEVHSTGSSFLPRLYSLIYIGDYASVYLALEYGINPTPVKIIDYLKAQMAQ
jgi:glucose/mannose-6-phosphate isomerase